MTTGPKPCGAAAAHCPARDMRCVPPEPAAGKVRLAVIGEGPGRNELEQGRPFIGASGRMLLRGLKTLQLQRGDVHWTNAILCEVPDERDMGKAAKCCSARLRAELSELRPPVVMPVGAWGLQGALQLGKKPQILRWRGSITPFTYAGGATRAQTAEAAGATPDARTEAAAGLAEEVPRNGASLVCPTIHPAFVMRAPKWGQLLEIDVARVGRVMRHGFVPPELQAGRRIIVARTRESLTAALAELEPGAPLAFDVETVGLGPVETLLVCFALSDGQLTVVVPWSRGRDGREPWWPMAEDVASEIAMALQSHAVVTHNGPAFDHVVAKRYNCLPAALFADVTRWEDTLLASHALRSHLPKGLSAAATRYLDVTAWKEQEDRTADLERLWIYNARDTLYTALLWLAMLPELMATGYRPQPLAALK